MENEITGKTHYDDDYAEFDWFHTLAMLAFGFAVGVLVVELSL